jgi:hypothetical protein
MTGRQSGQQFASAIPNAKLVRAIVSLVRRARVDYEAFRRLRAQVTERDYANLAASWMARELAQAAMPRRVDAHGERLRDIAMQTVLRQPEPSSAPGAGGD